MMKKFSAFLLIYCFCWSLADAQPADFNLTLVGNIDYPEGITDIWGYTSPDGTEYAVLGTEKATVIISLANPAQPKEIAYIEGSTTNWRDMKSWGHYAYSVADGNVDDGLLVIDLSKAPDSVSHHFYNPEVVIGNDTLRIESCHNLYIDENGFCYLAGCNANAGGPLILDLNVDPEFPPFAGASDPRYSHDIYVRGDTMWSADMFQGSFSVVDVSDKANPLTLATQETSSRFTHNCWPSDDGKFLFTTDEVSNAFVDAYDVTDLQDIRRVGQFRPQAIDGSESAPHNTHYFNGYLVTSWYTEGLKIIDAHRPENLIEVGSYDTFEGDGLFSGNWGAYPYLPSGLILASDRSNGLFVLQPTYQRASYLEGSVRDAASNTPLVDVQVEILNTDPNVVYTGPLGHYKTGLARQGSFQVRFSLPGYETKIAQASLERGEVTLLDVALVALPRFNVGGLVVKDTDEEFIPDAEVLIVNEDFVYRAISDSSGHFDISDVVIGDYNIFAGKWGFRNIFINRTIDQTEQLILRFEEGFQDDFMLDLGWTVSGTATRGQWERGEPVGTFFSGDASNPDRDIEGDIGNFCYVTGNGGGSAGFDDVDNGFTRLTSPVMDLSGYENPTLSYYTWFYNISGGFAPNDTLRVYLQDDNQMILLESITESAGEWRPRSVFSVKDLPIELTNLRLVLETADQPDSANIVEAAFDAFLVTEGEPTGTRPAIHPEVKLSIAPNPFFFSTTLHYQLPHSYRQARLHVYNVLGQSIKSIALNSTRGQLELGFGLQSGIYLVQIEIDGKVSATRKIVAK